MITKHVVPFSNVSVDFEDLPLTINDNMITLSGSCIVSGNVKIEYCYEPETRDEPAYESIDILSVESISEIEIFTIEDATIDGEPLPDAQLDDMLFDITKALEKVGLDKRSVLDAVNEDNLDLDSIDDNDSFED